MATAVLALIAVCAFYAGSRFARPPVPAVEAQPAVATYRGGKVTEAQLHAYIAERGAASLSGDVARVLEQRAQELLDNAVLAAAAVKDGLDQTPAVRIQLDRTLANAFRQRHADENDAAVTDAEVAAEFERVSASLATPERVRLGVIFVAGSDGPSRARAEKILREARAAIAASPEGFARVARSRSEDAQTRILGGQLPYLDRDELARQIGPQAAAAAFGMTEVGAIHPMPVPAAEGAYVLRLLGREPATRPSRQQYEGELRRRLQAAKRESVRAALVSKARDDFDAKVDGAALQRLASQPNAAGRL